MTTDSSSETMQASQWSNIFKVLKKKCFSKIYLFMRERERGRERERERERERGRDTGRGRRRHPTRSPMWDSIQDPGITP